MSISAPSDDLSVFDRLPDDVLLLIFNKLRDAKSLSLCAILCKRFRCLIPHTHSILLSIPACKISAPLRNHPIIAFASKFVTKPFRSLLRFLRSKSAFSSTAGCTCRNDSGDGFPGYYYYSPAHVLRNFRDIRRLELRLPSNIACAGDFCGSAMKWTAEFGGELKSCVIVGGTKISPLRKTCGQINCEEEELRVSDNEELKLRIVWTISCLIAASARHRLLWETMHEHRTVMNVTVTDDIGQGRLTMNSEQIEDMRRRSSCTTKTKEDDENCVLMQYDRTRVPALKMKMWIMPELELAEEGCVVEGATLVVIRPLEGQDTAEPEDSSGVLDLVRKMEGEFGHKEERVFVEVAKKLVKLKRSYTLEMNSF